MVRAIVGANWGDEGKGKITDLLASGADVVVRFQGGANAGHTIINEYGKFALHLLPSGAFRRGTTNLIGPGVALYVPALLKEVGELKARGVPAPNLLVSDRAQVLMPYHIDFDTFEEERLAGQAFGSTRSGMAPFYADRAAKCGFQVCELFGPQDALLAKLERVCAVKNTLLRHLYDKPLIDPEAMLELMLAWREQLRPYVGDAAALLRGTIERGGSILLEGQLGALRDLDHGIYPFTTSSSPLAGYAAVGAGFPPLALSGVIAVTKAYSSCVGAGPFVSEIRDRDEAAGLRERGGDAGEYGATTGRPRRMGWFDCVATPSNMGV
ncbi:MAG: adenylosuccinate synthetase, partial [Oscillospiraceae bacterium]|nr:adenylosuccinate synthetase [Oscillospiraceae bacterium]